MKKYFTATVKLFLFSAVATLLQYSVPAQKKVTPVTQSSVTGIALPQGAKNDSRMLTQIAAKSLLQMEAKKTGATVNSIEVLYLPESFNSDSLNAALSTSGWSATPSATDQQYLWLQKDGRAVLAYFSAEKKQPELYLGETNVTPPQTVSTDAGTQQQNTQQQTAVQQPEQKPAVQEVSQPAVKDGYAFNTTHFDDGWTSVIQDDWILVSKADTKVYLWYALPYDASSFSGTGVVARDYYWDNYVTRNFNVQTKQYNDNGQTIGSLKPDYIEGWATDKQTGEKRFIAMRLSIAPNTAYLVIASANDEASLRQQFPNANDQYTSDLANMDRYNKFAVSENDILGTWQDGNTSTMQWYYTASSGNEGYAGMTVAARSATFNFNAGGNYTSIHNGATGAVGAMNTFQQNYKGTYTVTNWSITATNRWEDKTENFDSWFKVIRGGRILCMDNSSMQYRLVKTK